MDSQEEKTKINWGVIAGIVFAAWLMLMSTIVIGVGTYAYFFRSSDSARKPIEARVEQAVLDYAAARAKSHRELADRVPETANQLDAEFVKTDQVAREAYASALKSILTDELQPDDRDRLNSTKAKEVLMKMAAGFERAAK